VAGAKLSILNNEFDASAQRGPHVGGAMTNHGDDVRNPCSSYRIGDTSRHRPPSDGHRGLGLVAFHARAFAGRQDHCWDCCYVFGPVIAAAHAPILHCVWMLIVPTAT
jgi:hypothetical protein